MNIFFLSSDPTEAAKMHCDQHLNKMILEAAQLLSTVAFKSTGRQDSRLYKPTHTNHPCTLWLEKSYPNILWLCVYARSLDRERKHRWLEKYFPHSSLDVLEQAREIAWLTSTFGASELTRFPEVVPVECLDHIGNYPPVSYQNYYRKKDAEWKAKGKPMKWTNREIPYFMNTAEA